MFLTPGSRGRQQSFASLLLRRFTRSQPHNPSDGVELFARRRAGRFMLAQIAPAGRYYAFQPHLASGKIGGSFANGGGTGITSFAVSGPTAAGTATTRSSATTSLLASTRRIGYVIASAAANQATGWTLAAGGAFWWRGSAAALGGFSFIARFGFNAFTGGAGGNRCFIGLAAVAWSSGDPSAKTSIVGLGFDSGDANFSVMTNDGSGTATKTDTGIAIAADKLYEASVFCAPNASSVSVAIERVDDGAVFELDIVSDLPPAATMMSAQVSANSGSSATTGAAIDIVGAYIETEA